MRQYLPLIGMSLAVVVCTVLFFSDGSRNNLRAMQQGLASQEQKNVELRQTVMELRDQVTRLNKDDRYLEKTARNELGLARPDELIFIFDDEKQK